MKSASSSARFVEIRLGQRFTPGVIALLGLFAATYVLALLPPVELWIANNLYLRPAQVLGFRAYQIVTAPLIMTSFLSLLFLGLLLFSLGSAIEQRVGTRRFLLWMAEASLAAAVSAAVVGYLWAWLRIGAMEPVVLFDGQPVFLAVLLAFAHFYGNLPVRMWGLGEPVSGRGLSYFFVGLGLVGSLWFHRWLEFVAQLGAVGMTLFILRLGSGGGSGFWTAWRRKLQRNLRRSGRASFTVMDGGWKTSTPKKGASAEPRWMN